MAELTLLIGLPGSGKSTYVRDKYDYKRIFCNSVRVLSSDKIREELYGNVNDQTHNSEVFQFMKDRAVELLGLNYDVVIDATNITRKSRESIVNYIDVQLKGFYDYGYIRYVVMATPYYKCLENNRKRSRQVPEDVIKRMYKNFEFPTYREIVHQIDIYYPFKIDNDMYGKTIPYSNLMEMSHDSPYHTLSIGAHIDKVFSIIKELTTDKVLQKAAQLHDIGKAFCKEIDEDKNVAHYLNHSNVGSYEAMFYGKMAKFTEEEIIELCNLIQFHMRIWDCKDNEKATNKLRNIISSSLYYKLLMLNIADREAH